ncbi:TOG array regulator of axonemal microtubules protein 1 [Thalassophryne amazonica]|uniref:TOG array regulator of axonemal microtubules protein 1 n=1 Tax=Thalassophryne amazonica TaxID=390379 RepID=UPI001471160A|nr:TOG array regulator of axonemal microtubules protein 1 [Thalassophryne amazonica]
MILGLISQELHEQLLDLKSYKSRMNGVEELKHVLSEVDMRLVPHESIEEFINFLPRLLDDSNFKVFYGTLQVVNLLIQKLDCDVDRYLTEIVLVALKALGDTCTVTRTECTNVFQQLMKNIGPQQVLDHVICSLKHKNSRVREDVLNIIIVAMLTHPKNAFNIPKLCFEVAPYLADSKRTVRHAALELFAIFDYCLEPGKKQPLTKAVDMVELSEDVEGLMAAVQARRARRVLPRLSSVGTVEYGLVVPKPGQQCSFQDRSGSDIHWVISRGRTSSARSHRTEPDQVRLYGYGSLGSLTDELPLQRRIVSASRGKNKLPWEASENDQGCFALHGKCSEQVLNEDIPHLSRNQSSEPYLPTFSSEEPHMSQSSRRREFPARLRRTGSLTLDPNFSDFESEAPKGHILSRNPSVECTFPLSSNLATPGSFLLPSYPLATLPAGTFTPTLVHCQANCPLSMSNTWPNKSETSSHQQDPSLRRDTAENHVSSRCSPRPLRASLVNSSCTSSFRRALSSTRATLSISPVVPLGEPILSHNGPKSNSSGSPQNQQQEGIVHLDSTDNMTAQNPQKDDHLDLQEMLNSLCSLHNSAVKKRARVSHPASDPNSPDLAVRLELELGSVSHTSPTFISSTSKSRISSQEMRRPDRGRKIGCGNISSSATMPHIARVPSVKMRSSASVDFSSLQGAQISSSNSGNSSTTDLPEGVIGRGVFGAAVTSSSRGVADLLERDKLVVKSQSERSAGIGRVLPGIDHDSDDSPCPRQVKERRRNGRFRRDKMQHQDLDQPEGEFGHQGDQPPGKNVESFSEMLSEAPTQENGISAMFFTHLNVTSTTPDLNAGFSPIGRTGPVSPPARQSPVKCFTALLRPSPPTVPPNPKTSKTHLRRVPSLSGNRSTASHSSDELLSATLDQKKMLSECPDPGPFSKPDLVLTQSSELLSSNDWEKKIEGLMFLRGLAQNHPDTVQGRLREVCLSVTQEVKSLRSGVARCAVCTLGELYRCLQEVMDPELEETAKALLHKCVEPSTFMRQDVDAALDSMVQHCTPSRCIAALIGGGLSHVHVMVRKSAAQHLAAVVERVGVAHLLSGCKDVTERILPAVAKLAHDSSPEARYYGREMLLMLSSQPDFDRLLEKYVPGKELSAVRDTVSTLKAKDTPSARRSRSLPRSGTVRVSSLSREPLRQNNRHNWDSNSHYSCRAQTHSVADKIEYVQQISALMASKDFRQRIKGIDQLVSDCQDSPNTVINSMFPLFDAFRGRLLESNSKVNLHALRSLQTITILLKDNLSQVVNILIPAIVDNHLNSKNNAIYSAAVSAVDALVQNIDQVLLLQPFCTKAQFLSGKAKVELIEKVSDLVKELYSRRPQMVEQKVLPLLWHLLSTSTCSGTIHVRGATAKLCHALYLQMGPGLMECAASQSANVHKSLTDILRSFSCP